MIDIKKIKFLEVGFVDDPKAVEDDTVGRYYPKETYINQLHGQSTSSMAFVTDAQYQLAKDMVKTHHSYNQKQKEHKMKRLIAEFNCNDNYGKRKRTFHLTSKRKSEILKSLKMEKK
tara:strand:- start:1226 stop:1576 length:351 start_codon:yes stop_codon:yes gene_type:complete